MITRHWNSFYQTKLDLQGVAFQLPAGAVRMAVGGEYMRNKQDVEDVSAGNLGNTQTGTIYTVFNLKRSVYSAYLEVVVPIVSAEMNVPLMRSFDLNLSGRYDNYGDVGETSNPKIAANWEVFEGLRFRGNYATAFVAPPLASIGIPSPGLPALGQRRGHIGVILRTGDALSRSQAASRLRHRDNDMPDRHHREPRSQPLLRHWPWRCSSNGR